MRYTPTEFTWDFWAFCHQWYRTVTQVCWWAPSWNAWGASKVHATYNRCK